MAETKRKRGRPKGSKTQKRKKKAGRKEGLKTVLIALRVTKYEKAILEKKARDRKLTVSEFLRRIARVEEYERSVSSYKKKVINIS